ncbi:hypothetical protein PENSPDRAFT_682895 [Peniophora sp. CONT]|nr:hypothetical protein PENSPDRAFT_682895 [Peniophora sp. CONT]
MSSSNVDVLIVGAGPVGLVSALALAQNAVSIRIVDKAGDFNIGQRGSGLMPRSLEAFKFLGIYDDYASKGSWDPFTMRIYDSEGKPVKDTDLRQGAPVTPEIPIPIPLTLGQDSNCAILRKHLKTFGVDVELSTELVTYEQDDTGVTATLKIGEREEKVRSRFLLGTDGAKGVTRRTSSIHFEGKTEDEIKAVIGDVEVSDIHGTPNAVSIDVLHNFSDERQNRFLLRPVHENPNTYFIFLGGPDIDNHRVIADSDYMHEHIRRISHHPELVISKIRTIAEWRLNERIADKFKVGRVLIAGDAAHCHSPTGGQGINSGVLDAMNLSWKLASVVKGLSPLSLLDTYEEERMPVIREMLRMTTDLADRTFKHNDQTAFNRHFSLRQLGVHYRWSSIVVDDLREGSLVVESTSVEPEDVYGSETPDRLHAGDRAPDAPELVNVKASGSTQLFDLLKPTHHTVLVFDPASINDVLTLVSSYPEGAVRIIDILLKGKQQEAKETLGSYVDTKGHAHRAYGSASGVQVVIIRPDGVVGGLLKSAAGIRNYFAKIFA